jgi:hypothetical protein
MELEENPCNEEKRTSLYDLNIKLQKIVQCRRFTLKPKRYYCTFYRSDIDPPEKGIAQSQVSKKQERKQKVILIQFPINLNDATTAHKLQGVTKKKLIVNNWTYTHGWVYTVLSRVRTREGLYLNKPLLFKAERFKLPSALLAFDNRIRQKVPERARI